jgi:hypothetical protein
MKENMKLLPMEYLVNELLERRAAKVARSVLRGGRQSNLQSLPDPGFTGKLAGSDQLRNFQLT